MEITKEQQEDIDTRIKLFLEAHNLNVKNNQVDFAMLPQHVQIAQGLYATQVKGMPIDLKYIPKESPYKPQGSVIKE